MKELIDHIHFLREKLEKINELREQTKQLKSLEEDCDRLQRDIIKMMKKFDLVDSHNMGWEHRIMTLLLALDKEGR